MYLIFDTETTGLPKNFRAPITDIDNWPRCIQIAWQLHDSDGTLIENQNFLIQPKGFEIPYQSEKIHGISTALALKKGKPIKEVIQAFEKVLEKTKCMVGQNLKFDLNIMGCEFHRLSKDNSWLDLPVIDTCLNYRLFQNCIYIYLKKILKTHIMQLLMWRLPLDAFLS